MQLERENKTHLLWKPMLELAHAEFYLCSALLLAITC